MTTQRIARDSKAQGQHGAEPSARRGVLFNFMGQGWAALMGLLFVPVYLAQLGTEGYGLIGFFVLLQAWASLLELGVGYTLSREVARYQTSPHSASNLWNLVRSCEFVCLAAAALIAGLICWGADWLALHWVRRDALSAAEVSHAITLMSLAVALRVMEGMYRGALIGAQRHAVLNLLTAFVATLRWGGAAAVLIGVQGDITEFFAWQALSSATAALLFGICLYRALPRLAGRARPSWHALASVWRFSSGMLATAALALVLTQADKLLLSRALSLAAFGWYSVAVLASNALYQLVGPITQAYYPRLAKLAGQPDNGSLAQTYHQGAATLSIVLAPAACVLAVFSESVLALWTQDAALASRAAPVLTLMVLGSLLNGIMGMAHMLQLAHGWPSLAARMNLAAVALWLPLLLWIAPRYGPMGTAALWLALQVGLFGIGTYLMHQRLLPTERARWFWRDTCAPVAAAAAVALCSSVLHPEALPRLAEAAWLATTGLVALGAAAATSKGVRLWLTSRGARR